MIPILTIAWRMIYVTYRDRNLLLIMIATPLALATIIGLAFGGSGGAVTISNIPVALVNLDEGIEQNGAVLRYGDTFNTVLLGTAPTPVATPTPSMDAPAVVVPSNQACRYAELASPGSLGDLVTVTTLNDAAAARAGVDEGIYAAAVIVPPNFSQRLASPQGDTAPFVEVYGSSGSPIRAGIVNSITEGIMATLIQGAVTVNATVAQITEDAQSQPAFGLYLAGLMAGNLWQFDFTCAFLPGYSQINAHASTYEDQPERSTFIQILVTIGTAQAMFFALFTAQSSYQAIFEEKKLGTLPRLFIAPITRRNILLGYMIGVFLIVLIQLVVLMLALTLVGSILSGTPQFIWGTSPLIVIMLMAITLSVCGIGILIISVVKNPQQANVISSLLNTFMAFLGGTFGIALPPQIAMFSPIYWAVNGLGRLSEGNPDIALNVLVLVLQGGVTFLLGLYFFNKRELA